MKKLLKAAAWLLLTVVLGLVAIYLIAWKSPPYYETKALASQAAITSFAHYNPEHSRPFVVAGASFVVFGAEHTRDPHDAQLAQLEQRWNALQPTVALVEGRLGFLMPGMMDPVKALGEGGKVAELARKDGIPLYNWDLSKKALAAALQPNFTKEQIALYQILTPYFSQVRFGRPADEAAFLEPFLERAALVDLQDTLKSVADIDRIWKKHFPNLDWRNVSDETTLPGYLNDIMAATNNLRNQQLVAAVKELTAKGERVFVVCGSSHAVCAAPAFP